MVETHTGGPGAQGWAGGSQVYLLKLPPASVSPEVQEKGNSQEPQAISCPVHPGDHAHPLGFTGLMGGGFEGGAPSGEQRAESGAHLGSEVLGLQRKQGWAGAWGAQVLGEAGRLPTVGTAAARTGGPRAQSHPVPSPAAHLGEDVALSPVDANRDLGTGGAELLEEAAVSADPQVILGYLHLQQLQP